MNLENAHKGAKEHYYWVERDCAFQRWAHSWSRLLKVRNALRIVRRNRPPEDRRHARLDRLMMYASNGRRCLVMHLRSLLLFKI